MIHVLFDTSIYRSDPPRRRAAFQALTALCEAGEITLHVPSIVKREFVSHFANKAEALLAETLARVKKLRKAGASADTRQTASTAGTELWPSYSYARLHGPGSSMPIHQDREASEVSVSICVGGDAPWPLWFRTANGDIDVNLEPGDGIVYYGQRLPHWREPGSVQVQCVLFYVRRDGPCAKHRFDGRLGIGFQKRT